MRLSGKLAIVTGANTGIGEVSARELVSQGAEVILACRSESRAREAAERIALATGKTAPEFLSLDLNSLAEVRRAADTFVESGRPLHLLVNNAGLAGTQGTTDDGFELAFGVNHLGHYLFTRLLEGPLSAAASEATPARVVHVASRAHTRTSGIDWATVQSKTTSRTGYPEYAVSKLANVLFSAKLAERWAPQHIVSHALHPGVVASDVWRRVPAPIRAVMKLFMLSNEEGAQTTLFCATSAQCETETGLYYDKCAVKTPSAAAQDKKLGDELWERSAEWTGLPV